MYVESERERAIVNVRSSFYCTYICVIVISISDDDSCERYMQCCSPSSLLAVWGVTPYVSSSPDAKDPQLHTHHGSSLCRRVVRHLHVSQSMSYCPSVCFRLFCAPARPSRHLHVVKDSICRIMYSANQLGDYWR